MNSAHMLIVRINELENATADVSTVTKSNTELCAITLVAIIF